MVNTIEIPHHLFAFAYKSAFDVLYSNLNYEVVNYSCVYVLMREEDTATSAVYYSKSTTAEWCHRSSGKFLQSPE